MLKRPLGKVDTLWAKRTTRLPVVLSRVEVRRLLGGLEGTMSLIGRLLYGTGMRLMEATRLRVKDVDFDRGHVIVREGKGSKDRVVMLPETLSEPWRAIWSGCGFFSRGIGRRGCRACGCRGRMG